MVRKRSGRKKVNTTSRGGLPASTVRAKATTATIYKIVTSHPCHVAGVHPHPNSFRLNQYFSGLSCMYARYFLKILIHAVYQNSVL
jgi:hypothetical protein